MVNRIIGHRGIGKNNFNKDDIKYTENTVYSVCKAFEKEVKTIEIDVQLTKDNKIVVYHDFYLNYKGKKFFIKDINFKEFKKFTRKSKNKMENPNSLHFLFKNTNHLAVNYNVELKFPTKNEIEELDYKKLNNKKYLKKVIKLLNKQQNISFISSFSAKTIKRAQKLTKIGCFFLTEGNKSKSYKPIENNFEESIKFALKNKMKGIVVDFKIFVENIKKSKICKSLIIGVYNCLQKDYIKYKTEQNLDISRIDFFIVDEIFDL